MKIERNQMNQLVALSKNSDINSIKSLSQKERSVLKKSIYSLGKEKITSITVKGKLDIEALKNKLKTSQPHKKSSLITRIFKGILNYFHLRISSQSLFKKIQSTPLAPLDKPEKDKKIDKPAEEDKTSKETDTAPEIPKQNKEATESQKFSHPDYKIMPRPTKEQLAHLNKSEHTRELAAQMNELDTKHIDLCLGIKEITSDWQTYREKIPEITLSEEEKKGFEAAKEKVKDLEQYIKDTYHAHFDAVPMQWHGRLSLQRMLWQDARFVEAIADPLVIKAMLIQTKENTEMNLASNEKFFLSSALLFGIGSNRLSYLVSVTPNWPQKPSKVEWKDYKSSMSLDNILSVDEEPRKVSETNLKGIHKGLQLLAQTLNMAAPADPSAPSPLRTVDEAISHASVADLIKAFNLFIDNDAKAKKLIDTGSTTKPYQMASQCFAVMLGYKELLDIEKGDHSKVLGYGLVSHALDARHLAAALFLLNHPESDAANILHHKPEASLDSNCFKENPEALETAKAYLSTLLKDASEGKLDAQATLLLKIRLQQVLHAIVESSNKLELDLATITHAINPSMEE